MLMRIQLAEEAVGKARISLEATRLDCGKQKKRLADLRKETELISTTQARNEHARDALRQVRLMEEEPNISYRHRAERIKRLVEPIAEWNNDAKALINLIDLEIKNLEA